MFFQNVNVQSGKVGKWETSNFFEKIWENPCTIQKKVVPLHHRCKKADNALKVATLMRKFCG